MLEIMWSKNHVIRLLVENAFFFLLLTKHILTITPYKFFKWPKTDLNGPPRMNHVKPSKKTNLSPLAT